ncbi:alpha/beta hydrolase [Streptomyces sp. NPDC029674]|uniref:alpha/beta hydrolase n=1 Tax=Streptomyces sp. NPDC029674 TaxID=3365297 RepID=UPI0038510A6D
MSTPGAVTSTKSPDWEKAARALLRSEAAARFLNGLDALRTADSEGHRTVIGHSYGTTLIGSAALQGELSADDVVFAGSPEVQVGSASERCSQGACSHGHSDYWGSGTTSHFFLTHGMRHE